MTSRYTKTVEYILIDKTNLNNIQVFKHFNYGNKSINHNKLYYPIKLTRFRVDKEPE